MKTIYSFLPLALLASGMLQAQSIYIEPWPVIPNEPSRLYVDISSAECACPELQDANPETNPLYIWTWFPNDNRPLLNGIDVNNGNWGESNPNLNWHQDPNNANLWYFDFLQAPIITFYGVDQAAATGINFILKESNGSPAGLPEQKSVDLFIALEFDVENSINDFDSNVETFEVYPNPTTGHVRVQTSLVNGRYDGLNLRVTGIDGRLIQSRKGSNFAQGFDLDLSGLTAGIYLIQLVQDGNLLATQRVVVQ